MYSDGADELLEQRLAPGRSSWVVARPLIRQGHGHRPAPRGHIWLRWLPAWNSSRSGRRGLLWTRPAPVHALCTRRGLAFTAVARRGCLRGCSASGCALRWRSTQARTSRVSLATAEFIGADKVLVRVAHRPGCAPTGSTPDQDDHQHRKGQRQFLGNGSVVKVHGLRITRMWRWKGLLL